MGHPTNSPRGLMANRRLEIADSTGNDVVLTADSSGLVLDAGVKISDAQGVTGNTTGLVFANPMSALPGNVDNGVLIGLLSNSTGVALVINSTDTTHKYLQVTSVQPT